MEDKKGFTDSESTPEKGYILRDRSNIQPLLVLLLKCICFDFFVVSTSDMNPQRASRLSFEAAGACSINRITISSILVPLV